MKSKKTVNVIELLNFANEHLKRTDIYADDKFKSGICVFIEHVLHSANVYNGYNDIYWMNGGYDEWVKDGQIETWPEKEKYIYGNMGKFSRVYYQHRNLTK